MANNKIQARRETISGSTGLLKKVLNTPNLPQVLRHMQSFVLVRMVQSIGVEDCEEFLEHLTPAQLAPILDEELWRSKRVGEEEHFDIHQAMRWLRVWNEIGSDHIVEVFNGLGVEYLATLVLQFAEVHEFSGVAWDMLNLDGFGSSLEEKDSHFRHVYGRFVLQIRSRDTDQLEQLFAALDALWECTPDFLEKTLSMCCNRSHQDEVDEENKGRDKVHEVEEILRDNLAKSREERRRKFGFLQPDHARDMLQRCRVCDSAKSLREFLMERYLWVPEVEENFDSNEGNNDTSVDFENTENFVQDVFARSVRDLEMEVLAATTQANVPLFLLAAGSEVSEKKESDLQKAVRVAHQNGFSSERIQMEIAGVANLLFSGCNVVGKRFEEKNAFDAALSVVNLGLLRECEMSPVFPDEGALGAFQRGMLLLHRHVALEVAGVLDDLVRSRHPDHAMLRQTFVETCIRKEPNRARFYLLVRDGRFFELSRLFAGLEKALPSSVTFCFRCLMSEFPVFPKVLAEGEFVARSSREWRFFENEKDFELVIAFLKRLPGVL